MNTSTDDTTMIEAFARVVAVDGDVAWLEPEPKTSCGSCASLACGAEGAASHIIARRFSLDNVEDYELGERIVVGIHSSDLLKAALTAYAIPLATMLSAGLGSQWIAENDGITLAASILGLISGLGIARLGANRLFVMGNMTPCFIRRADEACHSQEKTCHSK